MWRNYRKLGDNWMGKNAPVSQTLSSLLPLQFWSLYANYRHTTSFLNPHRCIHHVNTIWNEIIRSGKSESTFLILPCWPSYIYPLRSSCHLSTLPIIPHLCTWPADDLELLEQLISLWLPSTLPHPSLRFFQTQASWRAKICMQSSTLMYILPFHGSMWFVWLLFDTVASTYILFRNLP